MSNRTIPLTDALYDFMLEHGVREPDVLRRLRAETARHAESKMQIAPEQGQFISLLLRLMGARRTIEIGVFTGYSSTVAALALPDDGRVTACDVNDEYTTTARRYWEEAGVAHKIDLHLRPAAETLVLLAADGHAGSYDFAFIDADKERYETYYEGVLPLLRSGGLIMFDNMFRGGLVADDGAQDQATVAIRSLSAKLRHDARVDICIVPMADGLTLTRKR